MGLVGESGSGKSVTSMSIMRLIPSPPGRITGGAVFFEGRNLLELPFAEMRELRGSDLSMVFQDPMSSLDPSFTIGHQLVEGIRLHQSVRRAQAKARAVELLDLVGIPDAKSRMGEYAHRLSGGMRQRVMIAMALLNDPKFLIADEPTTALDVTIQAQILELLKRLQEELGMSMIFVTHDLGVVADICDRVLVMYAGQIVEHAPVHDLYAQPLHPYTEALLGAIPRADETLARLVTIPGVVPVPGAWPSGCRFAPRCRILRRGVYRGTGHARRNKRGRSPHTLHTRRPAHRQEPNRGEDRMKAPTGVPPILELRSIKKHFPIERGILRRVHGHVQAVDGVDLVVHRGESVGLVGESGSGKTTLGRLALKLVDTTTGTILFDARDITKLKGNTMRRLRRQMQMVFQDPYASFDPRALVSDSVAEPLRAHLGLRGAVLRARVAELFELVGLSRTYTGRYPHEFSGGQLQRLAVARAIATEPQLLVLDEPVSSLDVSTKAEIINLLADLQDKMDVGYLLIAHDLAVVRTVCDRISVMYLGRIVEEGDAETVCDKAKHPYTQALLSAIPEPDPVEQRARARIVLSGDLPSPANPPAGCRFHTRCPYVMDVCRSVDPPIILTDDDVRVACHLYAPVPHARGATGRLASRASWCDGSDDGRTIVLEHGLQAPDHRVETELEVVVGVQRWHRVGVEREALCRGPMRERTPPVRVAQDRLDTHMAGQPAQERPKCGHGLRRREPRVEQDLEGCVFEPPPLLRVAPSAEHVHETGVLREGLALRARERAETIRPRSVVRRRNLDRLEHRVAHAEQELVLAANVVVRGHGAHAELVGEVAHREVRGAVASNQIERGLDDGVLGERFPSRSFFGPDSPRCSCHDRLLFVRVQH